MRLGRDVLIVSTLTASLAFAAGGLRAIAQGQATPPAAAPAPPNAATPPAETGPVTTLKVFSRLTLVDVTVTDAKGEPVHNLKQSDFTLLEDGKPVPIGSFLEVGSVAPMVTRTPPKLPPHVYTNLQPTPVTSAINILLIDALNTDPNDQVFVKQETLKYLKSMPPGTRVAIFGLSSRLRILQGFTADPEILKAAVDTKKMRAMPSPFIDNDTADTVESISEFADAGVAASLQELQNEQNSFQTDMRNRMTMEALNQIAAYVAGIKGRKNLIWFTAGMPLNMFPNGGVSDLASMTDYSKDLRKTTDLLTAAQVAVYPVDARGLFTNPANSAANAGSGFASGKGNSMAIKVQGFSEKTAQEHLSMEAVAEATGGQAYYNTNGLKEAVGKAIENGSNYYTLSYVPPSPAYDGQFHRITVKVDKQAVKVGYREGYYADDIANNEVTPGLSLASTAPEPYGNNMQASMGRGVPTSSQILFDVRVEPSVPDPNKPEDGTIKGNLDPKLKDKAKRRYDFQYILPARQLSFIAGPGGTRKGSVQFDIAVYDVFGKVITTLSQTISLPIKEAEYQKLSGNRPLQYFQQLDLPLGEMFLRIGILDQVSDKVGTIEIPLTVPKKLEVTSAEAGHP